MITPHFSSIDTRRPYLMIFRHSHRSIATSRKEIPAFARIVSLDSKRLQKSVNQHYYMSRSSRRKCGNVRLVREESAVKLSSPECVIVARVAGTGIIVVIHRGESHLLNSCS